MVLDGVRVQHRAQVGLHVVGHLILENKDVMMILHKWMSTVYTRVYVDQFWTSPKFGQNIFNSAYTRFTSLPFITCFNSFSVLGILRPSRSFDFGFFNANFVQFCRLKKREYTVVNGNLRSCSVSIYCCR